MDLPFETHEEYVTNEIEKQKRKLRDINEEVVQVHQLIRLIIQVRTKSTSNLIKCKFIVINEFTFLIKRKWKSKPKRMMLMKVLIQGIQNYRPICIWRIWVDVGHHQKYEKN